MGLSNTVSTAFFTMILITGAAYLITLNIDLMKTTSEPLNEYLNNEQIKLGQDCEIDSWQVISSHTVQLNVTNTGSESIRIQDFSDIDLIVSYSNPQGDYVRWLSFDFTNPSTNYWTVHQVYTNGKTGDILNPISLNGEIYGLWDPGETIEILVYIKVNVQSFNYLKLVLPYGNVKGVTLT